MVFNVINPIPQITKTFSQINLKEVPQQILKVRTEVRWKSDLNRKQLITPNDKTFWKTKLAKELGSLKGGIASKARSSKYAQIWEFNSLIKIFQGLLGRLMNYYLQLLCYSDALSIPVEF